MATDIDVHIGRRLRRRRRLLSLTQQQLALAVGIRFQQIQKYECGAKRIPAGRLFQLAKTLKTPISYFYDGLIDAKTDVATVQNADIQGLSCKETLDLIQAYYSLADRPECTFIEELVAEEIALKRDLRRQANISFAIDVAARVRTEAALILADFAVFFAPQRLPYFFTMIGDDHVSLGLAGLAIAVLAAKLGIFVKTKWLRKL